MERAYAVRALGPDGGLQWVWGDYVDGGPEWDIDATSRWSRRWNLLKLIGEYARHNGHADIIRERINGQAGE